MKAFSSIYSIKFQNKGASLRFCFQKGKFYINSEPKNFSYLTLENAAELFIWLNENKHKFQDFLSKILKEKHAIEQEEEIRMDQENYKPQPLHEDAGKCLQALIDAQYEAWK
jgi:hypothetical protein